VVSVSAWTCTSTSGGSRPRSTGCSPQNPGLDGEDPRVLFSRMVTPETLPDYSSCLRRAAFGVLLVRAQHRAELADPSTGGEAA
jgi:hypothetical protein